jgi:hypothetical protein
MFVAYAMRRKQTCYSESLPRRAKPQGSLEAPVSLRSLRELLRTKTARHRSWPLSLFYFA